MVKITIEGKEVPRIVTHPEVPQPVELIEQRNGQRVSVETCRALEFGTVDPAGDGEAAELVRWLWEHAGDGANITGRWTGWQVAAWIATNNLAVVTRLASPIEFRVRDGGRRMLPARTLEACLRWAIAAKHCRCGAAAGGPCFCLDEAFGKLNGALREGALIELRSQSLGPVNRENAPAMLFARRSVEAVGRWRLQTELISSIALSAWIDEEGFTDQNKAESAHRQHFGAAALPRDPFREFWAENVNTSRKPGRRVVGQFEIDPAN